MGTSRASKIVAMGQALKKAGRARVRGLAKTKIRDVKEKAKGGRGYKA